MAVQHWELDPVHSEIHFKIRHLVISNITGAFKVFSGTMVTPDHDRFNDAGFTFKIDVYSIDTNYPQRDEHLKSADFFDADTYPDITFVSRRFTHIEGDNYKLTGSLKVKDVVKEITADVLFGGQAKDGFGIPRAGFEITGVLNRNDFNIHSNDVTEAGGLVVGEEIKLTANLQFTHKID